MARYRRVNIDGQSLYKTETRAAAALLPGTGCCHQWRQSVCAGNRAYWSHLHHRRGSTIRA
jgi:hypothetical protein